jgi:hypothetical protein
MYYGFKQYSELLIFIFMFPYIISYFLSSVLKEIINNSVVRYYSKVIQWIIYCIICWYIFVYLDFSNFLQSNASLFGLIYFENDSSNLVLKIIFMASQIFFIINIIFYLLGLNNTLIIFVIVWLLGNLNFTLFYKFDIYNEILSTIHYSTIIMFVSFYYSYLIFLEKITITEIRKISNIFLYRETYKSYDFLIIFTFILSSWFSQLYLYSEYLIFIVVSIFLIFILKNLTVGITNNDNYKNDSSLTFFLIDKENKSRYFRSFIFFETIYLVIYLHFIFLIRNIIFHVMHLNLIVIQSLELIYLILIIRFVFLFLNHLFLCGKKYEKVFI